MRVTQRQRKYYILMIHVGQLTFIGDEVFGKRFQVTRKLVKFQ